MKILKYVLILAIFAVNVNSALAAEVVFSQEVVRQPDLSNIQFAQTEFVATPVVAVTQPSQSDPVVSMPGSISPGAETYDGQPLILLNSQSIQLKKADVWAGMKFKVFDNKFVLQIDKNTFNADATLVLKEFMLSPASTMQPKMGFQMASKIYEYAIKTAPGVKFEKNFWFSIKYDDTDYFRKNLYFYDDNKAEWKGLPSIISDGASKVISQFPLTFAKLALLEDITIMTEGTASWYKYKGCNCAASPDYPKGTKLKVTNVDNGKSIIVKVNDWGPDRSVVPDRVIDLDVTAFKQIANKSAGLCKVKVELVAPVKAASK